MKLWDKIHKYLPIIGIILFIFVIWKIGPINLFNSLIKVKFLFLILAALLLIPIILIQVFKWYYIVKLQGFKLSFYEAFKFHIVSSFLALLTPGRIGLLSKVFFLKKNINKSTGECTSSVILDKALDFIILFIFGFFGSLLLLKEYKLELLIGLALVFFIIMVTFLFNKKITRFFLKWGWRFFIPQKFKERIRLNFHSFYESMPKFKKMIIPFFMSFLNWMIIYTQLYMLLLGFNININYISFVFIMSIVNLIILLPITVFGIGTREFSLITLFSSFNINNSDLVAFSITSLFLNALVFFIGYMIYARKINLGINDGKTN